ncbi:MAG: hypothetical protein ACK4GC_09665, partial [Paracoccaceae bacterium]
MPETGRLDGSSGELATGSRFRNDGRGIKGTWEKVPATAIRIRRAASPARRQKGYHMKQRLASFIRDESG